MTAPREHSISSPRDVKKAETSMNFAARIILVTTAILVGAAVGGFVGFVGVVVLAAALSHVDPNLGALGFLGIVTGPVGVITGGILGGRYADRIGTRAAPTLARSNPRLLWTIRFIYAGTAAYIAGGFVAGVIWFPGAFFQNPDARLNAGFIACVRSIVSGGFIESEFVQGESNVWPFILGCWLAFLASIACSSYSQRASEDDA